MNCENYQDPGTPVIDYSEDHLYRNLPKEPKVIDPDYVCPPTPEVDYDDVDEEMEVEDDEEEEDIHPTLYVGYEDLLWGPVTRRESDPTLVNDEERKTDIWLNWFLKKTPTTVEYPLVRKEDLIKYNY